MIERYHYKMSGLDNVYLSGEGIIRESGKYGDTVRIPFVDQLNQLIATDIATRNIALSGKELRFLRVQLDLSQKQFAALIDSTKQNIGRYERDELEDGIPGPVQTSARLLYLTYIQHPETKKVIEDLAELDRQIEGKRLFCLDGDVWEANDSCH